MADNLGVGGEAFLQQFLNNVQVQQGQQQQDIQKDSAKDAAVQASLARKAAERKAQLSQAVQNQLKSGEAYTSERSAQSRWRDVEIGRGGPELQQLANNPQLQQKLSGKLKEMVLDASAADPARAAAAAQSLGILAQAPNFSDIAPTAREVTELAAQLLRDPSAAEPMRAALGQPFMRSSDGDREAKAQLLRFAGQRLDSNTTAPGSSARNKQLGDGKAVPMGEVPTQTFGGRTQQRTGISVVMGADMLEGMRDAKLPGFAQRAGMQMIARDPSNVEGVRNIDAFVQEPAVRAMPALARGYATQVLSKGMGDAGLKTGLTEVAEAPSFRTMGREAKAQLYATIGQGRAPALRAITDKTLLALRSEGFPVQQQQVGRFLTGLSRAIGQGAGTDKEIDGGALVAQAKRGGMPQAPQLKSLEGLSDEEANEARTANRSALMGFYGKLNRHYDQLDQKIRGAKYFEQVSQTTGLKEATEPDLSALAVRPEVAESVDAEIDGHKQAFRQEMDGARSVESREAARTRYIKALKTTQSQAFAKQDLSVDEKTYVYAKTTHSEASETFSQLAGKKQQKMREVRKSFMPPEVRRRQSGERRPVGVQQRYFRSDGRSGAGEAGARLPGASMSLRAQPQTQPGRQARQPSLPGAQPQTGRTSAADGARAAAGAQARAVPAGAQAGAARRAGAQSSSRAGGSTARAAQNRRGATARAEVQSLLAELDPSLSLPERMQQATEMITQRLQEQARMMGEEVAEQLLGQAEAAFAPTAEAAEAAAKADPQAAQEAQATQTADKKASITTGVRDGYGIPRTNERDLGGRSQFVPVRAPGAESSKHTPEARASSSNSAEADPLANDAPTGREAVREGTPVRPLAQLYTLPMKDMTRAESALFRNLGWDPVSWASRNTPGAPMPRAYATPYKSLTATQRSAVRRLGMSAQDWDVVALANAAQK